MAVQIGAAGTKVPILARTGLRWVGRILECMPVELDDMMIMILIISDDRDADSAAPADSDRRTCQPEWLRRPGRGRGQLQLEVEVEVPPARACMPRPA
eukprot:856409-Rhodomonas_salina.3